MQTKAQMQLDQAVRTDHIVPIVRPKKEQKEEEDRANVMALTSKDKTYIPNWLMGIIIMAIFSLLAFVYNTIDRQLNKLDSEQSTQRLLMQNLREKLIEHKWTVDDKGFIHPPIQEEEEVKPPKRGK